MTRQRRISAALLAMLCVAVLTVAGCSRAIDGTAVSEGSKGMATKPEDFDRMSRLLLECDLLAPAKIAQAVGGGAVDLTFLGAICRWRAGNVSVTFNWFEWGALDVEKRNAAQLGFTTENVRVASQSGFRIRDPRRPQVCGMTARANLGGIYTWWVEPDGPGPDPCTGAQKLMEMTLNGGQ